MFTSVEVTLYTGGDIL